MSVTGNNLLSGLKTSLKESVGRRENLMFISGLIIEVRNFTSQRPKDFNPPKQSGIYVSTNGFNIYKRKFSNRIYLWILYYPQEILTNFRNLQKYAGL